MLTSNTSGTDAVWYYVNAAVIAVVLSVPFLFNHHATRVFEPTKQSILVFLVSLSIASYLILRPRLSYFRLAYKTSGSSLQKALLVLFIAAFTSQLISVFVSLDPKLSFYGSDTRAIDGFFTNLVYGIFFVLVLLSSFRSSQIAKLSLAIIVASVPVCFYAVMQSQGMSGVSWGGDVLARASSTQGNPLFLAAYLVLVIPVTIALLLELGSARFARKIWLLASLLLILGLQINSVWLSQSRGAMLAIIFMLVTMGLAATAQRINFRLAKACVLAVFVSALIFVIVATAKPGGSTEDGAITSLESVVFDQDRSAKTAQIRLLIWGSLEALIKDQGFPELGLNGDNQRSIKRLMFGYGQAIMGKVAGQFIDPDLHALEAENSQPDYAHNSLWDRLFSQGLVGLITHYFMFLLVCLLILRTSIGALEVRRVRFFIVSTAYLATLSSLFLFAVDTQQIRTFALAIGLAPIAALWATLLWYVPLANSQKTQLPARWRLLGFACALLGHWVEQLFGVPTLTSGMVYYLYLALICASFGWQDKPVEFISQRQSIISMALLLFGLVLLVYLPINALMLNDGQQVLWVYSVPLLVGVWWFIDARRNALQGDAPEGLLFSKYKLALLVLLIPVFAYFSFKGVTGDIYLKQADRLTKNGFHNKCLSRVQRALNVSENGVYLNQLSQCSVRAYAQTFKSNETDKSQAQNIEVSEFINLRASEAEQLSPSMLISISLNSLATASLIEPLNFDHYANSVKLIQFYQSGMRPEIRKLSASYENATLLRPWNQQMVNEYAQFLLNQMQAEKAIELLSRHARETVSDKNIESRSLLALAYFQAEKFDKALVLNLQLFEQLPRSLALMNNIIGLYIKTKNDLQAQRWLERAIEAAQDQGLDAEVIKLSRLNQSLANRAK